MLIILFLIESFLTLEYRRMPIESFLTQLSGINYKGKIASDPALKQGTRYNSKQERLVRGIVSNLSDTKSPTVFSTTQVLREHLENKGTPLQKINKAESVKLNALEEQFNKTLTEYTKQFHEYNETILQGSVSITPACHILPGQSNTWECGTNTTEDNCNTIDPWRQGEENSQGFTKIGESSRCWWGIQNSTNTPWSSPTLGTCSTTPIQTTVATLPNCKTICEGNRNCNAIAHTIGTNKCKLYSEQCKTPTPETSTSLYQYNRSNPNVKIEQKLNITRAKINELC